MWESLGFTNSPYNANPLSPCPNDVDLLAGRSEEMVQLCTQLDAYEQGVFIISGNPGVGKTSFFNISQYLMEVGEAPCGPKLLCARKLCAIQPKDDVRDVAQRAVISLVKSVEDFCVMHGKAVPKETRKVAKWISSKGGGSFDFGLTLFNVGGNFGRSVELPAFSDTTFERLQDVLGGISSEIRANLGVEGAIIALDNIENLEDEQLIDLLVSFRDTLFSIPYVWWILIGQAGLSSLIKTSQPKVYERIAGSGIDLKPLPLKELHDAIEKRVIRFHALGDGVAPLPEEVHRHLYTASHGEIRFVFKYGGDICTQFIGGIRNHVFKTDKKITERAVDSILGRILVEHQIPADRAESVLKHIVSTELNGLNLKKKERDVLKQIGGAGSARASNYKDYGVKTMADFSSNYLSKLHRQDLLLRRQQGKAVSYQLRGLSSLAAEYKLL